jgi:hypothetical protein
MLLILSLLLPAACDSSFLGILSELPCGIPATPYGTYPVHIDGFEAGAFGVTGPVASRYIYSLPVVNDYDAWALVGGSGCEPASCELLNGSGDPVITVSQSGGYTGNQVLVACTPGGDTLWTCTLEGTDEFDNCPVVAGSEEEGYLVSIRPDCNSNETRVLRLSPSGEVIFSIQLSNYYLLDLPEFDGETGPGVESMTLTRSGDVLLSGSVSEWFTTPEAWFVCILDGDTGEPVWKASGFGLGMAGAFQAIETESGLLLAVGSTSIPVVAEGCSFSTRGENLPLLVVLDGEGNVLGEVVIGLQSSSWLTGIACADPSTDEYLAAGTSPGSEEVFLVRMTIPTDPSSWR